MKRFAFYGFCGSVLALLVIRWPAAPASSAVPPDFTEALFVGGLAAPTSMAFAPDGRLFVTEQDGAVRVIEGGVLLPTPFVTLPVNSAGERGLLGLAFDPNFAANQFVYVYYTVPTTPLHNRVSRFTAAGNVAVPGSELILLDLEDLGATNHNGGALHFGPDGLLYVAVGENAVGANAQNLGNQLGKILRLDPAAFPNIVPPDNPFVGVPGVAETIWAYGLRNPFTFAFQPGTSRMYINDVGANTFEEINQGSAGANYGWPLSEGPTGTPGETGPIFFYPHAGPVNDSGCAITGGVFYNPLSPQFPAPYTDDYFFADLCNRWIKHYDIATASATTFADNTLGDFIVDLDVGADGTLYYLAYQSDAVFQITYTNPNPPPPPPPDPTPTSPPPPPPGAFAIVVSKVGVAEPGGLGLVGEPLIWVITLTNTGTVAGLNIVVTDTVAPELRLTGAEIERGTATINGQTVTFTLPVLNAGQTVTARIFTVIERLPASGLLSNTATLTANGADGSTLTRTASATFNSVTGLPETGYPR